MRRNAGIWRSAPPPVSAHTHVSASRCTDLFFAGSDRTDAAGQEKWGAEFRIFRACLPGINLTSLSIRQHSDRPRLLADVWCLVGLPSTPRVWPRCPPPYGSGPRARARWYFAPHRSRPSPMRPCCWDFVGHCGGKLVASGAVGGNAIVANPCANNGPSAPAARALGKCTPWMPEWLPRKSDAVAASTQNWTPILAWTLGGAPSF